MQHMAAFFYPTLGPAADAFADALAFTNSDVFRALPGYQVMGSHYHTDVGRSLMAAGSVDSRMPDFEALRAAGINIAGPVDRPRDETQLEEQYWLFEGAKRHSDATFMVMPQMENSNLLGGHWDLLFGHPVAFAVAPFTSGMTCSANRSISSYCGLNWSRSRSRPLCSNAMTCSATCSGVPTRPLRRPRLDTE
jgi:hypothetical protein